jgi:diguanylate cyclase (GGDEF)-like protein
MQLVPSVCSLSADATLFQAVQAMHLAHVDYVLVVATPEPLDSSADSRNDSPEIAVANAISDATFLGMITHAQILQQAIIDADWQHQQLGTAIAQMQPIAPLRSQDLEELAAVIEQFQHLSSSALPVVNPEGQLLGMLTFTEAWQAHSAQVMASLEAQLQNHEQHLQQYQSRLEGVLNSLEDVVWSVLPGSLQLLYINTATQKVFGRPIADFLQQLDLWYTMVYPEDRLLVEQAYEGLANLGQSDLEYRILLPNQDLRWVRSRLYLIRDPEGQPCRIDGITTDITERRVINEQLQFNALHDSLTGLANRSLLTDRIQQSLNRNRRHPSKFLAVLFLDLDRFKVVNDSLGHHVGDQLLIQVAQRLRTCQRLGDTVARLGGDEFVLLLEDLENREDALRVAQRVHDVLSAPLQINVHEIFISVSIGIAFSNGEWANPAATLTSGTPTSGTQETAMDPTFYEVVNSLLRDADTAMYRAKALGTGQHQIFDQSMHTEALRQLSIETELRRLLNSAIEPIGGIGSNVETNGNGVGELLVYYQPIINLENFEVEGFEALVRWQHPQKGLVSPAEFIPIAEETGLIVQLDRWVITTAYRQLQIWLEQFPQRKRLSMSVNLSSRHFESPGLITFFDRMLQELALDPSLFKLEITETTVVKNPRAAAQILEELQTRGIQICLDDFGTGYASLSYLQSLPFHVLKIDRSFIDQLGENHQEQTELQLVPSTQAGQREPKQRDQKAITRAIINLGNNLGLGIVAEGIEGWEQVNQLKSLNCSHGQGYLFARPMNSDDSTTFLVDSPASSN